MDAAAELLRDARTIAVVGLDARTNRTAYRIASYLQQAGYRGFYPADEVLGERAYESLRDVPGEIDLVDVFVRSGQTAPVIDDAIAVGARGVWLQVGIRNDEALAKAKEAGLVTEQDRCTMVVHRDLLRFSPRASASAT
ncbi:MAG TPA: CoA-binding protein [Tepidiformaceae bacterium]|mgnify:CR=1 FL=1|nr:CoA-binding protein [Tepidiformaceae bacterium]